MNAETIADWLLSGLELKSTLFHVGQYCGAWQASTAGHRRASFHVVLRGECWLHLAARPTRAAQSVRLQEGDAVFLLQDMPHCLSPHATPPARLVERIGTMVPLSGAANAAPTPSSTPAFALESALESAPPSAPAPVPTTQDVGLACGFFEFQSGIEDLLLGLLPDHLLARRHDTSLGGAAAIFELMRAEALRDSKMPSPLLARLTDLLFFYALRAAARHDDMTPGLWALARRAEFGPLVTHIIDQSAQRVPRRVPHCPRSPMRCTELPP
ncbi:MAG: cupin domain-containing protein [Janthinobacterium lividum]